MERLLTKEKKQLMLKALTENYGDVSMSAKQAGIARKTHYEWMRRYEKYREKALRIQIGIKKTTPVLNKKVVVKKRSTTGYVYLVHCKGTTSYKIGISKIDYSLRLSALQSGCPLPLEMIYVVHSLNYRDLEKNLHHMFKDKCVRGEWFDLDYASLNKVMKYLQDAHQPQTQMDLEWSDGSDIGNVRLRGLKAEIFKAMKARGITNRESAIGPTAIATLHKEHFGYDRTASQPNISRALKGMSEYVSQARYGKYFVDDKLVNHP